VPTNESKRGTPRANRRPSNQRDDDDKERSGQSDADRKGTKPTIRSRPSNRGQRKVASAARSVQTRNAANGANARNGFSRTPNLLDVLAFDADRAGLAAEEENVKLAYLIAISSLLEYPFPAGGFFKGASAAGKSTVVDKALAFLPPDAVVKVSTISDKGLFYNNDQNPIKHKVLYITEAAPLKRGELAHIVRTLLSEHYISNLTVTKGKGGQNEGSYMEVEGPAALITTTVDSSIEQQLDTRLIETDVDESAAQTRRVLRKRATRFAGKGARDPVDYEKWHKHFEKLKNGPREVIFPEAELVEQQMPPEAMVVHMRRGWGLLESFIGASALLHRDKRKLKRGRIVATLDDYEMVRHSLNDILARSAGQAVPINVRRVVDKVQELSRQLGKDRRNEASPPNGKQLSEALQLDYYATRRAVLEALKGEYLVNGELDENRPYKLRIGEPLPESEGDSAEILPDLSNYK